MFGMQFSRMTPAHLQWCSSLIRRCLDAVPAPGLQVDIFVTNATPEQIPRPPQMAHHQHPPPEHMMHPQQMLHGQPTSPTSATSPMPLIEVMSPTLDPIRPVSAFPEFALNQSHAAGSSAMLNPMGGDGMMLAPPKPGFARSAASSPRGSLDSNHTQASEYSAFDLSYYRRAGSSSHLSQLAGDAEDMRRQEEEEIHDIADLTNWDGEDDHALPGENRLSKQVAKAGTKMRMVNLRKSMGGQSHASRQSDYRSSAYSGHVGVPGDGSRPQSHASSVHAPPLRMDSQHGFHLPTSGQQRMVHGPSPLMNAHNGARPSIFMPSPIAENAHEDSDDDGNSTIISHSRPDTPTSAFDVRSSVYSGVGLIPGGSAIGHRRTASDRVRLDIERKELRELAHVAEFARPGKPNIYGILRNEVEQSRGAVVVAVCGPTTLNTVVRKAISNLIDPGLVRKGDMRGMIDLVSEEFEY
jgi:hypothetical protein